MVVRKRDMQKAPKKYQEKVFEEFKELEEQKGKRGFGARTKEAYAYQVGRRRAIIFLQRL